MEIKERSIELEKYDEPSKSKYERKEISITDWYREREQRFKAAMAKNYQINFLRFEGATYDTKNDRYVGKFLHGRDNEHSTIKLSNAVAIFLLGNREHYHSTGNARLVYVYLHLNEKGEADDAMLMLC